MAQGEFLRTLGRLDVFALAFGAMIGWSWVILAGVWVEEGGFAGALLAFLVGGVAIALIGLTYAELAAALPFAGGEHVYSERAFGRAASFLCTWSIIFGYVSVVAFEAIALPVALTFLFPDLRVGPLWTVAGYQVHASEAAIGAGAAMAIAALNIAGVRVAAAVQSAAVLFVLAAAAVLVTGGLAGPGGGFAGAARPVWGGFAGFAGVLMMVPFLFVGFDVIPQSAEEIGASRRAIGAILVISVMAAVAFYMLVVFAVALAGSPAGAGDLAAAIAAGELWRSEQAAAFVVLAGVAGILTSWNAFLIGGSRAVFALARAGLLPSRFASLHPRTRTPWAAILLISVIAACAPLLGRSALVWFVNAGGLGITIAYAFVAAAFLVLRRREPALPRPFTVMAGPLVGGAALILSAGLMSLYLPWSPSALAWPQEWGLVAAWYGLGLVLWALVSRR